LPGPGGGTQLTYQQEAVGFVEAAKAVGVPAIVPFTVETDGRLPNGGDLREAIDLVDEETSRAPVDFMIIIGTPPTSGMRW
jgi:homocysteine S-methyltransferase